jgi:hypothetical protein
MKPEAQRIAIAEFCGWTGITRTKGGSLNPNLLWWGYEPKTKANMAVPDYLNDLNAIVDATSRLSSNPQWVVDFLNNLRTIVGAQTQRKVSDFLLLHSTCAQRAEALLRTIGKWRDEP